MATSVSHGHISSVEGSFMWPWPEVQCQMLTRKTITCVTCYKRRCWKVLMSNNRWRIIMKFFFAMRYTLKRLWNDSLNAWLFANKPFNQTVMGKQAFVNTCYHLLLLFKCQCQFMSICLYENQYLSAGKEKLDCITSLDIQYSKKRTRKSMTSQSERIISHAFSSFWWKETQPQPWVCGW